MLLDVLRVKAYPDYSLQLEFENGEIRCFDMAPYMGQRPWVRLQAHNAFLSAHVENGTVAWPGNIDIDPETLYDLSVPGETTHAADRDWSPSTNTKSAPDCSLPATSPASPT